ncbi:hypothetical protein M3Y98_00456500 [Aphelenchoides besseyi]|nr:hypothetical protein M3Y98_00456500 [Aphelenchoides besseyi]KAI6207453.1 hypothetical protein M3Y96_00010500 [Aphelenchoides besseyi]
MATEVVSLLVHKPDVFDSSICLSPSPLQRFNSSRASSRSGRSLSTLRPTVKPFFVNGILIFDCFANDVRAVLEKRLEALFDDVINCVENTIFAARDLKHKIEEHGLGDVVSVSDFPKLLALLRPDFVAKVEREKVFFEQSGKLKTPVGGILNSFWNIPLNENLEGTTLNCLILDIVEHNRSLIIRPADFVDQYQKFKESIRVYTKLFEEERAITTPVEALYVGEFVFYYDHEAHLFYRAQIMTFLRGYRRLNIRLVDEGRRIAVEPTHLFRIPAKFRKHPPFCLSFIPQANEHSDLNAELSIDEKLLFTEALKLMAHPLTTKFYLKKLICQKEGRTPSYVYTGVWHSMVKVKVEPESPTTDESGFIDFQ